MTAVLGSHVLGDQVEVRVIDLRPSAVVVRELTAVLDDGERARYRAIRDPGDRDRYAVTHGAARLMLAGMLAVGADRIRWRRGRWGKPELDRLPGAPCVSLSHSGDIALVAVATRPVGVDVELVRTRWDTRPPMFEFPRCDVSAVRRCRSQDRGAVFTQLITRKEACVKAAGDRLVPEGLRLATSGPAPLIVRGLGGCWRVCDLDVAPGYRAAVARQGAEGFAATVRPWIFSG